MRQLFTDPWRSPVAFKPLQKIYDYVKNDLKRKDITLLDLKKFQQSQVRANQIFREYRPRRSKTLSYRSAGLDSVWQIDLADLHRPRGQQGRYAFLLTCIDVFSRRGDAELVYDKSATNVLNAFKQICRRRGRYPDSLHSDLGKEFVNTRFRKFCTEKRIKHYHVMSDNKAAVVERFNCHIQNLLARYRYAYPREKIKNLVRIAVPNYNRLPHLLHSLKPVEVEGSIAVRLMRENLDRERVVFRRSKKTVRPFKFHVGDTVRTVKARKTFFKGYRGFYTEEVFVVSSRFRRKPQIDVNLYRLRDLTGEPIVDSVYYESELQRVSPGDEKRVEKVFRRDKRKGKLVKLLDYPPQYREWVK